MQALSPLADKLKEHHTRLVFIGSSTVDQMEEFMRSPTVLMSGELILGPHHFPIQNIPHEERAISLACHADLEQRVEIWMGRGLGR